MLSIGGTKDDGSGAGFHRPYFGGRILNLLQMITGELEGRSGKSVRVSELRCCACCGPSRPPASPPASLCGFLSYLCFTGYEGMGKKKKKKHPEGSRQEVPAPRIKVGSGSYCDVLTCSAGSLGWVQFSALHSVRLSGSESSSHCTALRTKCTKNS